MLLGKLGYMFIISYLGQDIINHTDEVSQKAYVITIMEYTHHNYHLTLSTLSYFVSKIHCYNILIPKCEISNKPIFRNSCYFVTLIGYSYYINISIILQDKNNSRVFYSYDSLWYTAPVRARKLLLFTMLNNAKPSAFTMLGGLFKTSFEVFLTVTGSSIALIKQLRSKS